MSNSITDPQNPTVPSELSQISGSPSAEHVSIPGGLGSTESTLLKLVEYGGFVAAILALCLFFLVLTEFVKRVKED